jgi:hypothetical protein
MIVNVQNDEKVKDRADESPSNVSRFDDAVKASANTLKELNSKGQDISQTGEDMQLLGQDIFWPSVTLVGAGGIFSLAHPGLGMPFLKAGQAGLMASMGLQAVGNIVESVGEGLDKRP